MLIRMFYKTAGTFFRYKIAGISTSTLFTHLHSQHGIKAQKPDNSQQKVTQKKLSDFLIGAPPKQVGKSKADKAKFILARRISLHLCCRSLLPFGIVESQGFQDFLVDYHIVESKSEIPHRTTISRRALQDVVSETEKAIRKVIVQAEPICVALAYDLWTDAHARNPYANTTAIFIDKEWNLIRINLGTNPLEHPHTAVNLEKHFVSKIDEFGLNHLPMLAVKDNGANVKACAKLMSEKFGFSEKEADDQNCFAHCIHLLITSDVLKQKKAEVVDEDLRRLVVGVNKIKRIHHALVYKKTDIARLHAENESLKLQGYLDSLDNEIGSYFLCDVYDNFS